MTGIPTELAPGSKCFYFCVLTYTEESNFGNRNEKNLPSYIIWLHCGLTMQSFSALGKSRAVSRAISEQRNRTCHLYQSAEESTQEPRKLSLSIPWQHSLSPASPRSPPSPLLAAQADWWCAGRRGGFSHMHLPLMHLPSSAGETFIYCFFLFFLFTFSDLMCI